MTNVLHTGLVFVDHTGTPTGMKVMYYKNPVKFVFDIRNSWGGGYYCIGISMGYKVQHAIKETFIRRLTRKVSDKAYMKAYYALSNT